MPPPRSAPAAGNGARSAAAPSLSVIPLSRLSQARAKRGNPQAQHVQNRDDSNEPPKESAQFRRPTRVLNNEDHDCRECYEKADEGFPRSTLLDRRRDVLPIV